MTRYSLAALVLNCFGAGALFAQTANPQLATLLRGNDERLLNAVHRGDRVAWENLTTPDFMYVEEGSVQRRAEFLRNLAEDGYAPLLIRNYEVKQIGNTALVFHEDDVPPRPGRDTRNSHLLMTETWQRVQGIWKLRIVHVDRIRIDPPAVQLTPAQIDELIGTYRSEKRMYQIERKGSVIVALTGDGEEITLKAETRDVLFVPGEVYTRMVFLRDSAGRVTSFVRRNESSDEPWEKVAP